MIELVVVVGIAGLFIVLITPSWIKGGQNLALDREASAIAQGIKRASELSLSGTFFQCSNPGKIAGYGVYFDLDVAASYRIYADCNNSLRYDPGDGTVEVVPMENEIAMQNLVPSQVSISFFPPDPLIYLRDSTGGIVNSMIITLATPGGNSIKTITINSKGVETIQ